MPPLSVQNKQQDELLVMRCYTESLSDTQKSHTVNKRGGIQLLKTYLQSQLTKLQLDQTELDKLTANLENGFKPSSTPASARHSPIPHTISTRQRNITPAITPKPYSKTTVTPRGGRGGRGRPRTIAAVERDSPAPSSQTSLASQKGLTESLRATRLSTGSLPPKRIAVDIASDDEDEPEIEVIKESTSKPQPPKKQVTTAPVPSKPVNDMALINLNPKPKGMASASVNSQMRKELDLKVKTVLMKSQKQFIEWLMEEGLIRPMQGCAIHKSVTNYRAPGPKAKEFKLGVISEPPSNLTSAGGYVWIAECCGMKYVSVFSGAIFAMALKQNVPPSSIIKLFYHWSCQTALNNVETWVKVDKTFICTFYKYMKAVCSIVLHNKVYDFGVNYTSVELGIVSLGTTTADGVKKAVKVEILGLYDRHTKAFRLFASTPDPSSTSKERFNRILKPVFHVVHSNATIVCDQSIDPSCLNYKRIQLCKAGDDENDQRTNGTIMAYLRKHVPKVFQSSLSQLAECQVQLVLDELCWREKFAHTSADCYGKILSNMAYLTTKEVENPGVIPLLEYTAANPSNAWRYKQIFTAKVPSAIPYATPLQSVQYITVTPTQHMERIVVNPLVHLNKMPATTEVKKVSAPAAVVPIQPAPAKIIENMQSYTRAPAEFEDLEPYFYTTYEGNANLGKDDNPCSFICHLCEEDYGTDNFSFYTHLRTHLGQGSRPTNIDAISEVCKYCCKALGDETMEQHVTNHHVMSDNDIWCRICTEKFPYEHMLKTHMMKKHVEAEMPYRCCVCQYATSFFYGAVDHFEKQHANGPYVQCRLCLSVKVITPENEKTFSQELFHHLQQHTQRIACKNCMLVFYSKSDHAEHRKEHVSCSSVADIKKYVLPPNSRQLQFRPNIRKVPVKVPTGPQSCEPALGLIAMNRVITEYKNLNTDYVDEDAMCMECKTALDSTDHFRYVKSCTKCAFSTQCKNAFFTHYEMFHSIDQSTPKQFGNPTNLETALHCGSCGYTSKNGNNLAKHLANNNHSYVTSTIVKFEETETEPETFTVES